MTIRTRLILILFFLIALNITFASSKIPLIDSTEIPEGKIAQTVYYDGNSLWGYIDGGADLYLEYGFVGLQVQKIVWKNDKITIDIYQMTDSKSAFGIFSVKNYNCSYSGSDNFIKCVTPYQMQIVYDDLYISIVNSSGTSEAAEQCEFIFKILLKKLEKKEAFKFPGLFTNGLFKSSLNNIKYFKGILGIQNGAPEWIDKFEKFKNFSLYYLPIEESDGSTIISIIDFSSDDEFKSFLTQFDIKNKSAEKGKIYDKQENGKSVILWLSKKGEVIYLESLSKQDILKRYLSEIENFI